MASNEEVARLPVPERLTPKISARSLKASVKLYFYTLYNSSKLFRDLLASVGNRDSINGNRMFDRGDAVTMIKEMAAKGEDSFTATAKSGLIYKHVVDFMGDEGLGLIERRKEYNRLTHQAPAE